MKRTLKTMMIAGIALAILLAMTPKKHFEGKIIFSITFNDLPEGAEQYAAMLPKETVLYVKGNKTRTEQSMGMGGSQIVIADSKTDEAVVLMDMMGQKLLMKMNREELSKNEKEPKITYLDGTLEIAGYTCKKASISFDGDNEPQIVYYTEDIPAQSDNHFNGLKGFPLQYEVRQNSMHMTVKAEKISSEDVPDKLFEIPDGYKEVTKEEMKQMFGG